MRGSFNQSFKEYVTQTKEKQGPVSEYPMHEPQVREPAVRQLSAHRTAAVVTCGASPVCCAPHSILTQMPRTRSSSVRGRREVEMHIGCEVQVF